VDRHNHLVWKSRSWLWRGTKCSVEIQVLAVDRHKYVVWKSRSWLWTGTKM
jgi:hypothetical protein